MRRHHKVHRHSNRDLPHRTRLTLPLHLAEAIVQGLDALARGEMEPAGVYLVEVRHRANCGLLAGGDCNCRPSVCDPERVPGDDN